MVDNCARKPKCAQGTDDCCDGCAAQWLLLPCWRFWWRSWHAYVRPGPPHSLQPPSKADCCHDGCAAPCCHCLQQLFSWGGGYQSLHPPACASQRLVDTRCQMLIAVECSRALAFFGFTLGLYPCCRRLLQACCSDCSSKVGSIGQKPQHTQSGRCRILHLDIGCF